MKQLLFILFLFALSLVKSQTVTNGDFSSATAGWACNPETNPENVYGGGTSNPVAEVDELAGLCQTISGFVIGNVYRISLDYSRRTGGCPGPNPAGANVIISNGTLNMPISSNVGSYTLQNSAFTFTATQTTLTLSIAANFVGTTCGLIIDNISIVPYNPLPIELVSFSAEADKNGDELQWITASQVNNDFFTIERSTDAITWKNVAELAGAGNSLETLHYNKTINETLTGIYYYRLKQTDYNKQFSYSPIVSVERVPEMISFFPNPATNELTIQSNTALHKVELFSMIGELMLSENVSDNHIQLNVKHLAGGVYFLTLYYANQNPMKEKIIVQR
jgi:hypothetical protein